MRHTTAANHFDTVRLIAALMVVYAHSMVPFRAMKDPFMAHLGIYSLGYVAVMTFFVISGYLITMSWLRQPHLLGFMRNRLLRLMPALAVVILLSALVLGPVTTTLPLDRYFADPVFSLYFNNLLLYPMSDRLPGVFDKDGLLWRQAINGSLWTLRIEFTMYLLVAALGVLRLLRWPVMMLALLGFAWLYFVYAPTITEDWRTRFLYMEIKEIGRFGMCFAIGSLVCLLNAKWFYSTGLVVLSIVATIAATQLELPVEPLMYWCIPAVILWTGFQSMMRLPNLARYGDMSYGVYMYAYPIQQLYLWHVGAQHGFMPFVLTSVLLALLAGYVSWHIVEKCALRYKYRPQRKPNVPQKITAEVAS